MPFIKPRPVAATGLKAKIPENRVVPIPISSLQFSGKRYDLAGKAEVDGFVKTQFMRWLSKKRQMRGAEISRNEAYLSTPQ